MSIARAVIMSVVVRHTVRGYGIDRRLVFKYVS
jgi:hypothetical protein